MTFVDWVNLVASIGIVLVMGLAHVRAARAERTARRCEQDMQTAMQLVLVLSRAVLDHEMVDKLAAGVMWAPRDDLDVLLQAWAATERPGPG